MEADKGRPGWTDVRRPSEKAWMPSEKPQINVNKTDNLDFRVQPNKHLVCIIRVMIKPNLVFRMLPHVRIVIVWSTSGGQSGEHTMNVIRYLAVDFAEFAGC